MKKSAILTSVAVLALTILPLAACDNDSPAQGEEEAAAPSSPIAYEDNTSAAGEATGASDLPVANVDAPMEDDITLPPPAGSEVVAPADGDTMGNSGPGAATASPNESAMPPAPNPDVFKDASCDFEDWVGKALDEAAIKAEGRPHRILKPGDAVTMDHNPERINVEHENGAVTRVWCG